jgi:hypothetical protein
MSRGRASLVLAVSAVLMTGIAGLTRVPFTPDPTEDALIRLSWRYRGTAVETCRTLTDQERATLPLHMQRDTICDGSVPPHRLLVSVDGQTLEDGMVAPAGARGDRPMFVMREFRVAPGEHRLEVSFGAEGDAAAPPLELSTTVDMGRRQIAVVTVDEVEGRLLVVRQ